jgi:ubiquinone/menaquinone biosynthesis C-methylase UbiE
MALQPRPSSILDIGIGNGKYGFLAREYLGYWGHSQSGGPRKDIRIDGIEAHPDYISAVHKSIYDRIFLEDARLKLPEISDHEYDLILFMDVLEHFNEEDGKSMLRECQRIARGTIVATPIQFVAQEDAFGNPYERHRSLWTKKMLYDLEAYWVLNGRDKNWISFFSDDAAYRMSISEYRKTKSGFRNLVRCIAPYSIRQKLGRLLDLLVK